MAIKVNSQLTSKTGVSIPSGSVVSYQTIFPHLSKTCSIRLYVYASEDDLDNGKVPFKEVEEFPTAFKHTFTKTQLLNLNFTDFEVIVLDHIESYVGQGTCTSIDKIPDEIGSPS